MDNKENIAYNTMLIINLGGIGDVLLSTPALKMFKNNFPKTQISILVVPRVCEIVKDLSCIDNIFVFSVGYKISFTNLFKNFYILLILRKRHFDLAINMRTLVSKTSAKKIKFLIDIINPRLKAGRDTEGRGYFFDIKIPEPDIGQKYEMEYDIGIAKALGAEVGDKTIDFDINKESIKRAEKILQEEGVCSGDLVIGIHPGGKPSHRWPIENFSKVIDRIHKKIFCKFIVTGGKDELFLAERLMKIVNVEVINLAGRLSIKELCALIERCNVFISNDTGPMHIAAILKIPLVALFGPGNITRYDPRNISDKAVVLYKKADCAPCEKVKCKDLKCLKIIFPEEVIKAALKLLGKDV